MKEKKYVSAVGVPAFIFLKVREISFGTDLKCIALTILLQLV